MAKKISYLDNLMKEVKQTASAWKRASDASGDIMPGANARARKANKTYDNQKGQLLGALVQGRRYGAGGAQIKATPVTKTVKKKTVTKK
jgi:ethanolamine ammonia-lyase large subunit